MTRIISDTSSNVLHRDGNYKTVPFKFVVNGKNYTDDETLNLKEFVDAFDTTKESSSSSCPNIFDWLDAFDKDGDNICVTISSNLSGSYNSAMQAKAIFEEENGHKVEVVDSLSAGPEPELDIEKIDELIRENHDVTKIKEELSEYKKHTGVFFLTSSVKNLVNNGRVTKVAGLVVSMLHISMVGIGNEEGKIEIIHKTRKAKAALDFIFEEMKKCGYKGGKVRMSYCFNEEGSAHLAGLIKAEYPESDIKVRSVLGLCSYYVENKGIIIAFEH